MEKASEWQSAGIENYYNQRIEELEQRVRDKRQNLKRLEAQRNEMNSAVKQLKEEISLLQEPGSYVGEVVKLMGKGKALVKVRSYDSYHNLAWPRGEVRSECRREN